jgi:hypothetical protein
LGNRDARKIWLGKQLLATLEKVLVFVELCAHGGVKNDVMIKLVFMVHATD